MLCELFVEKFLNVLCDTAGFGRGDKIEFLQARASAGNFVDEWFDVPADGVAVGLLFDSSLVFEAAEHVVTILEDQDVRSVPGDQIFQFRDPAGRRFVASLHAVGVLDDCRGFPTRPRFDTPKAATGPGVGIGFPFQPTQRVCAACHVGVDRGDFRQFPEARIQTGSKPCKTHRIPENEDLQALVQGGLRRNDPSGFCLGVAFG